jgi:hypothetical protein
MVADEEHWGIFPFSIHTFSWIKKRELKNNCRTHTHWQEEGKKRIQSNKWGRK